ncbi:hypothetical protein ARALYDRAFT_353690 [Arabidopsis lyrata subsp. lyrata]|uniref:Uncharacterized protein n=1 Tax=Arabidopsis lyrata subsp. lyrata TaxID=81972 RepID=D7MB75_ARALL|nr:hypothetical protein ARALYDRAFT_353690 [Arabidopsis lyrata subsp. lyrata]
MSNTNEQENATRTNVKRKRFTEMEVDMIMPDPSPKGNNYYSAFEMNLECAKKVPSTNRDQRAATFDLGGICCLFPGNAEELQAAVRSMGRRLTIIKIPSDAARNGFTVPPKIMDVPKARAIFGYLVIMLYKNVNESNFREFSNKRFKALRAVASCIEEGYISVFNDVEDAICCRNSYDMAGYCVVEECLVYPDSPVLKAPELATEIYNAGTILVKSMCYFWDVPEIEDNWGYSDSSRTDLGSKILSSRSLQGNRSLSGPYGSDIHSLRTQDSAETPHNYDWHLL